MKRTCGSCSACCVRLPVKAIGKGNNQRCIHQSRARGCKVYHGPGFPMECGAWKCRWLYDPATNALSRPDRSGYVIDAVPDFIRVRDNETGAITNIEAIQIWCDPDRRDAHRDPKLREYLERAARNGVVAVVRYSAKDAFVLFAPCFTDGRGWVEQHAAMAEKEHTAHEIAEALGGATAGYEVRDLRERPL